MGGATGLPPRARRPHIMDKRGPAQAAPAPQGRAYAEHRTHNSASSIPVPAGRRTGNPVTPGLTHEGAGPADPGGSVVTPAPPAIFRVLPRQPEGWPSGLRRTLGKRVYGKPYRGFESHSLRQNVHLLADAHEAQAKLDISPSAAERHWTLSSDIRVGELMRQIFGRCVDCAPSLQRPSNAATVVRSR